MKHSIHFILKDIKKIRGILILLISFFSLHSYAQEKYGTTVNLGVGIGGYSGYYHNLGGYAPVVHLDVEFPVARNFTLAPFINFYSYTYRYHLNNPYGDYVYKVNIIPVGVKGTYYLDELLQAGPKWDFYVGGSLGVVLVRSSWNDTYYYDHGYYTGYYTNQDPHLYLDLHIGAEYHVSTRVGLYLDLSNGLSTVGIAIH
jgi:hypothetical protein